MLVLSSPSGAGKTTLARRLREEEQRHRHVDLAHHAAEAQRREGRQGLPLRRPRRPSPGCAITGEFLEWAVVFDNFYGTTRQPVEQALAARPRRAVRRRLAGRRGIARPGRRTTSSPCLFFRRRRPISSSDSMSAPRTRRRSCGAGCSARATRSSIGTSTIMSSINHDIELLGGGGARDPRRGTATPLAADRPQGVRAEIADRALARVSAASALAMRQKSPTASSSARALGSMPSARAAPRCRARSAAATSAASCASGRRRRR